MLVAIQESLNSDRRADVQILDRPCIIGRMGEVSPEPGAPIRTRTGRSSFPGGWAMPDPRYATPEYRAAYKAGRQAQARGQWLECQQPVCLHPTRDIAPDQPIDIAHDDDGLVILGPAHRRCNRADGGRRRHLLAPSSSRSVKRRIL